MLDEFRPRLLPTARVRLRSDGTHAIYDPASGRAFETAADQSKLVPLLDGTRTLSEIAAEHLSKHGFVPFAALNDLTRALANADLLANSHEELERVGLGESLPWTAYLEPWVLFRHRAVAPRWWVALEGLLWLALAAYWVRRPSQPIQPADVGLFYVGAAVALTLRSRFKAAVSALGGFPPERAQLAVALGVLHWVPDAAIAVLLDKRLRLLAHLAALAGSACAMMIGHAWPGFFAGALVVLLVDLCPFAPTSAGTLIATLAGKMDLREHVRAYVGMRMLKSIAALRPLKADRDLFLAALASLAWIAGFSFLLTTRGIEAAVQLIEVGAEGSGFGAAVAYLGAVGVFTLVPLLMLMLLGVVVQAAFSVLWSREAPREKRTGGVADLSAFRSIPLFSGLSQSDLAAMAAASRELLYAPGQTIVEQGTRGDTFYAIRSGAVEVVREDESGRSRAVARLGAGDCFGETALLQDGLRTATVRAISETVATELSREAFEKVRASFEGVDIAAVLKAAAALGESRLFRELPAERRSALAMKFVPRNVPLGTEVVRFGEPGDEFYLVGKGQLEVLDAKGAKLGDLSVGDHFGEIALLRNTTRTATVRTVTDSVLLALSREVFLQALSADMMFSSRMVELAQARVADER